MQNATLTIAEVARRVGLKTSAIRYYESVGVLPEPQRIGGQRRYGEDTIGKLRVLNVAKRAGFSLDEAKVLLATTDGDTPAYQELRELAAHKLPEVNALISRAQAMRDWLTTATGCGCESLDVCALFEDGAADSLNGASADELVLQLSHVRP